MRTDNDVARAHIDGILEELARELGLPAGHARLTADDATSLRLDDGTALIIMLNRDRNALDIHADLGFPPVGGREALYALMLQGNMLFCATGGCTLGLDRKTGHANLNFRFPLETLDYTSFRRVLEQFLQSFAYWKRRLTREEAEDASAVLHIMSGLRV